MTNKEFINGLANGKSDIIQKLLDILSDNDIHYCVIGGLAVNAYVEPVVSLDLDIVVAIKDVDKLKSIVSTIFKIKEFPYSINLYSQDSDIRIQIQTDERYQTYVERTYERDVLGYKMQVASLEDVLMGKIWAYLDKNRRRSKRQKDLADIFRIIESYPELDKLLPEKIGNLFYMH
ncbi:MAG: hypothetical protein B6242_13170 [Anaerolineaceae bacterium 4572_78]|nr:MAG: hypothetical protein B6242_13170 [Anaerolineaceae bacterium 4572_78]